MGLRSWIRGDDIYPPPNGHGVAVDERPSPVAPVPLDGDAAAPQLRSLEITDLTTAMGLVQEMQTLDGTEGTSIPAVYRAIQLISDLVASIPLGATNDATGMAEPTPPILAQPSPDPEYTRQVLLSEVMSSLLFRGHASIRVYGADLGQVHSMRAVDPDEVTAQWAEDRLHKRYFWRGREMRPGIDFLHIDLNDFPGHLMGVSPVTACRLTLTASVAEAQFGRNLYLDDATPSGIIEVPQKLTRQEAEDLLDLWEGRHRNRRRPAVGSGGATFKPLTIDPVDSDFLESRKFGVKEVARMFGLSAFWLNEDPGGSLTYVTIESMFRLLITSLLQPTYFTRIESALYPVLPPGHSVVFRPEALLTADTEGRYRAYQSAAGWLTINEIRAKEGLPPIPGGDALLANEAGTPTVTARSDG